MTKSQKRELTMIIIGAVLLAAAVAVTHIFLALLTGDYFHHYLLLTVNFLHKS